MFDDSDEPLTRVPLAVMNATAVSHSEQSCNPGQDGAIMHRDYREDFQRYIGMLVRARYSEINVCFVFHIIHTRK